MAVRKLNFISSALQMETRDRDLTDTDQSCEAHGKSMEWTFVLANVFLPAEVNNLLSHLFFLNWSKQLSQVLI